MVVVGWCGGGGGGGECQRIKVMRSRVYPLGQLPTIKDFNILDYPDRKFITLRSAVHSR